MFFTWTTLPIFILSDGEFNNSVSTSQTIFQDDSTVYGTVALHNAAHTPIHSFACQ